MPFTPAFAPPAPATGAKPDTASAEISTDVSYLPDLQAYLDDLLRSRERLLAAATGLDEWARADALPSEEEITRIRRLITRIKEGLGELTAAERDQIGRLRRAGPGGEVAQAVLHAAPGAFGRCCTTPVATPADQDKPLTCVNLENIRHARVCTPRERAPGLAHPHLRDRGTQAFGRARLQRCSLPCYCPCCPERRH